MILEKFIEKVMQCEPISFNETIIVITENYYYLPTEFKNGSGDDILVNNAGMNEGSCKIFAFAKRHQLTKEQTLNLFGDYYRVDVLTKPNGDDHQNIRNFIKYGWEGINFNENPLTPKANS
jgi:hypothetical protein